MTDCLAAFRAEIRRWPTSALFWWLLVVAPTGGAAVLCGLFGSGLLRELPVLACDLDHSAASRALIRQADALPGAAIAGRVAAPAEALAALRRGKAYGLLIVPRHYERDLLRGREARPVVYVEGRHMAAGGVLRRDFTDLGGALWRAAYVDDLVRSGAPPQTAPRLASAVDLDARAPGNPAINYRRFLGPAFLPILLQIGLTVYGILRILARREAGAGLADLLGTLAAPLVWAWCLLCAGAALQIRLGDMAAAGAFRQLCGIAPLFLAGCGGLALFLAGLCDERLTALMLASAFCSPAFAFSGLTFPLVAMPAFARFWAGLLPSTHLLRLESAVVQMGASPGALARVFAAAVCVAAAYGLMGAVFHLLRLREAARC